MIPTTKSYTPVRAQDISPRISEAVLEFPTVISDLISQYSVADFTDALKPLRRDVDDPELNRAIKDAFSSPECDPKLKVDIIYLAVEHQCHEKLRLLIAELLDSGQDVYLNNTKFVAYGCHLDWLFMREDLLATPTPLPGFGKVHFSGACLSFVYLDCAYLPGAIFKGAHFSNTGLSGAFLYGADFSDTNVVDANFKANPKHNRVSTGGTNSIYLYEACPTNLSFAKFTNSDISGSRFSGAIMQQTNFCNTKNLDKAVFDRTDISRVTVYDPKSIDKESASLQAKWAQIYVTAYNQFPTPQQATGLQIMLDNYDPDALLEHAERIGKLGDRFFDFVEFSKQTGGQTCDKNLWLISQGIRPVELAIYNQYRAQGRERSDAVRLIKENRPPA